MALRATTPVQVEAQNAQADITTSTLNSLPSTLSLEAGTFILHPSAFTLPKITSHQSHLSHQPKSQWFEPISAVTTAVTPCHTSRRHRARPLPARNPAERQTSPSAILLHPCTLAP